ncbi:hypothetical protein, partial [Chromohalobacter sp. HP20-39]|uniref:hypothetical protein n=1 Tax=Chromohalobacter sp. HP20-39 TaxID=3079306 RepID=UPI00294B33FD
RRGRGRVLGHLPLLLDDRDPLSDDQPGRKQMSDSQDDTTPVSPQGVDRKADSGCPVMHDSATAQGSESENPAID